MPPENEKLLVISFDGVQAGQINIPAQEFTVPESMGTQLKAILTSAYDSGAALKTALEDQSALQAKHDALEEEKKTLQGKFDALEKGNPEQLASAVQARLGLEKTAAFFKVDKAGEMGEMDLMKAVILSQHKELKLDEKDDVYINARYDIMAEEAAKGMTGLEQLQALHVSVVPKGDNLEQFTGGQGDEAPKGSRASFMNQSKDAFKTPPGAGTANPSFNPTAKSA